jgi:CheY-like chemotaxis protein
LLLRSAFAAIESIASILLCLKFRAAQEGLMNNDIRQHKSGRPYRVLVADDISATAEMVAEYLRDRGCQVFTTDNGHHAQSLAEKLVPDLAILNFAMTGISGIEVLKRLRANPRTQHMNVVIDSTAERVEALAQEAGAQAFIQCPLSSQAIDETANRLLR